MTAEAALAGGYAAFLVVAALTLDVLARHSHRRSERFRVAGFRYHEHLDAWECPEGEHLLPYAHDDALRLVRYRAKAHVCNACPAKASCTDSSEGREVVRSLEPWVRSEAGRFHRGLAAALVGLAAVIAAVALARNANAPDGALLGAVLALAVLAARHLGSGLRAR